MATSNSTYDLTPDEIRQLGVLAVEAKAKAYCPSSNFRVGAAIIVTTTKTSSSSSSSLSDDEKSSAKTTYHSGSNVEVASTPVGICAERCAIAPVIASYTRPEMPLIRGIAVSTDIWPPSSPCGMCRQFIREFCGLECKVYMYGKRPGKQYADSLDEVEDGGDETMLTVGELLPMSFGPNDMDKRG